MRAARSVLLALPIAVTTLATAQEPPPWEAPAAAAEIAASRPPALPEGVNLDVTWVQLPPTAFLPSNSTVAYMSDSLGKGRRWPTSGGGYFQAPIDLPQGAKITNLGVFFLDNNATASIYGQLVDCGYSGSPCESYPSSGIGFPDCTLDGWVCSGDAQAAPVGSAMYANLTAANVVVNNYEHSYYVNVFVQDPGGTLKIGGAVVGYRLQVSPAPATATFPNDVPTTHPYFRFIEALADAGITAGCGPGSFCPNSPITRGEMAVFLAVALGLHWAPVIF